MRWRTVQEFRHQDRTMLVRRPEGEGDGPAFVLVHGIGVSARYFTRLARALAPHGTVHAVELPGFGAAPRPPEPLTIEEHAATLDAWVREAGLEQPVVVGHSMGVQVVLEAALQDPRIWSAVVAVGGVVDPAARTATQQALRLAHDMLLEPPLANWAVLTDYLRTGPRWYLRTLPHMLGYRTEETLPRLEVPLLVMRGARDPIASAAWVEHMRRLAPDARLVEVQGAAHVAMYSRPEVVAGQVLAHARAAAGREPA
ncbi:alpha/beta fold hydrolase [Ornithinimicrobium pekingense]|uniref:Alpha/beta hydrolase n=1 Tax=Ornithinimicrobium pekingense TaxID=384677 RepID=A0ABQ2FAF7_9MICO|nr:alpha/beta fold hydrolase [Ornithinimicrobium pekingense]GGK68379.1 alpha/beta hydrolase [Ornithinimicrobium pekingense]